MIKFFLITFIFSCLLLLGCSSSSNYVPSEKSRFDTAHINVELGLLYLQQGDIEIAKTKLLIASKQALRDAKVHDALGYFFSHTGELDAAETHYLYAIKLAAEKSLFRHNYGKFLYQHGHYQLALAHFLFAARDINYLHTGEAYADASYAAKKMEQKDLARKYHTKAVTHGFSF